MASRRKIIAGIGIGGLAAIGGAGAFAYNSFAPKEAEVGFQLSPEELSRARAFLKANPAIDVHAHPGRTFVHGSSKLAWKLRLYTMYGSFEAQTIADMVAGNTAAVVFNGVADFPVLDVGNGGLTSRRKFREGEAWKYYQAQSGHFRELIDQGLIQPVLEPGDIAVAIKAGKPGAIYGMEGTAYLEDDAARIATLANDGVRIITLVHYRSESEVGDIITAPPVHNGLSEFGRKVVKAMNANRIMVDVAHGSEKMARDTLEASSQPVVATHTYVNTPEFQHPRFISKELAKAIAENGGYVGAWPAGIGVSNLKGFVDRILALVEMLGIDAVAIGSDMDANYKPVYENYRKLPLIVGALMKAGMTEPDLAKVTGGNFMRVFNAVRGA